MFQAKKRVLFLRSAIGVFGAERMILELAQAISNRSYEPIIGVIENRHPLCWELVQTAQSYGLKSCKFKCKKPFDLNTVLQVRKYIFQNRINLIHTHGYKANFYGILGALNKNIPCLATCHPWTETHYNFRAKVYTFLDKMWLRRMNTVIAVSNEVKQQISNYGINSKIDVIINGINTGRFNGCKKNLILYKKLGYNSSDIIIGTIGRLIPEKGYHFLINSTKSLCSKLSNLKILFIGDGPLRTQLEAQVLNLKLNNCVKFLGVREDIPELLSLIDIFVLTSISEGTPMALLEAMAASKPIVTTSVGAIPQIIHHKVNGLLIPPRDTKALTSAIEYLITHPEEASRMATAAQQMILNKYSSKHMAEQYIQHYERLID